MSNHLFGVYLSPNGSRMNGKTDFWDRPFYEGDDGNVAQEIAQRLYIGASNEWQVCLVNYALFGGGHDTKVCRGGESDEKVLREYIAEHQQ